MVAKPKPGSTWRALVGRAREKSVGPAAAQADKKQRLVGTKKGMLPVRRSQ